MISLQKSLKAALLALVVAQVITPEQINAMSYLQTAKTYVSNTKNYVSTQWGNISQDPIREGTRKVVRGAQYIGLPVLIAASTYDVLWNDIMTNYISVPITALVTLPLAISAYESVKDTPQAQRVKKQACYVAHKVNLGLNDEHINLEKAGEVISQGVGVARKIVNPRPILDAAANAIRAAIISAREFGEEQASAVFQHTTDAIGREFQNGTNAINRSIWKVGPSASFLTFAGPFSLISAWFGGKYILHKAMQKPEPKVFRSTSEKSKWERFKNWSLGRTEHFPEMIYNPDLEVRLNNITKATININEKINQGKTNVFYRNVLLEGPPGTGKTYFARNMVRRASEATDGRMKWRETDGSALLKGGIPAIDEMFEWAEKQTGVCIFIDEADTLFGDRDKLNLNDEQVIVLNHLLNRLGDRSNKYMIIMATNRKIIFDAAMQRRIDDLIEIPLPAQNERARVLQLYRNTILLDEKENNTEFIASAQAYLDDDKIRTIAQGTEGLSNGDLQGIMTTIKSESDITDNGLVTNAIVDEVVQRYVEKNQSMNAGRTQPKVAVVKPNNNRKARRR